MSEDSDALCCAGMANYHYIDLVVVNVYQTELSKEQIREFYREHLNKVRYGVAEIVFLDDVGILDYDGDGHPDVPDDYYWDGSFPNCILGPLANRFEDLTDELDVDRVHYVLYGWSSYGQIWEAYCH